MSGQLNHLTTPTYNLLVIASDGSQTSEISIGINVTDAGNHAPQFASPSYYFDVHEDAQPNTIVGRVIATDYDLGLNGKLTYAVVSRWGRSKFHLDQNYGVLTLIGSLNYEQVPFLCGRLLKGLKANRLPLISPKAISVSLYA